MDLNYNEVWMEDCDIGGGSWMYDAEKKELKKDDLRIKIRLNKHLTKIQIVSEKNDRTISGTVSAGIVGAVALGPLGALAGSLYGGKRDKETVIYGELSDGNTFVGKCDNDVFPKLLACVTKNPESGPSIEGYGEENLQEVREKYQNEGYEILFGAVAYFFGAPLLAWYFEWDWLFGVAIFGNVLIIIFFIWVFLNSNIMKTRNIIIIFIAAIVSFIAWNMYEEYPEYSQKKIIIEQREYIKKKMLDGDVSWIRDNFEKYNKCTYDWDKVCTSVGVRRSILQLYDRAVSCIVSNNPNERCSSKGIESALIVLSKSGFTDERIRQMAGSSTSDEERTRRDKLLTQYGFKESKQDKVFNEASGGTSSGTSLDKSEALSNCRRKLESRISSYSGTDSDKYRQMSRDLDSCMAGHGYY